MAGLPEGYVIDQGGPPKGYVLDEQPSHLGADVKQFGIGAGEGLLETPDVLGNAISKAPGMGLYGLGVKGGQYLFNKAVGNEGEDQTYAGGVKHLLEPHGLSPDQYPAQGLEQRLARTTGQFLGSPLTYTGPGGVLGKIGTAIPSAIGSELAGTAAAGTKWEPLARTLGAVAAPSALSAGRRLLSPPEISPGRAAARDVLAREGVDVSAGQLTGNESLKYKEATSGAPGQRLEESQQQQLTRAALRRIGEDADSADPVVLARARDRIGQELEDATANMRVRGDPELTANLTARLDRELTREGYSPDSEVWKRVDAMRNDALGAFDFVPRSKRVQPGPDHLEMTGEAFHERIRHNSAISRAIEEKSPVSWFAGRIRNALYDAAERTANRTGTRDETGDRLAFARLQDARRQWRNLLAIEDVVGSAGDVAAGGQLTPAMVRRLAIWKDKTDYSRNRSDYAELARAANRLMQPLPKTGAFPRMSQLRSRIIGGTLGFAAGVPTGVGHAIGAAAGAVAGPWLEGRAVMSPWGQRYYSSGAFPRRSGYEHLARTARAAAPTLSGYADGGDVENPYATDAVNNALDTGAQIADSVSPQSRMDQAYQTSVDRWKALGKGAFFAGADIPKAPPWQQAMGLMGGLGSKGPGTWWTRLATGSNKAPYARWTPEEDAALAKYIKSDETVIPDELAHRSETALQARALTQGLREPALRYKRTAGDVQQPPGPRPDYLNLAAEPRAALLLFERAAAEGGPGGRQAKAILNQYTQTAPTKRDALLQGYIDNLRRAGWKPGMRRGGAVRNPYAMAG